MHKTFVKNTLFQHTAARRRLVQSQIGGIPSDAMFQHTAARRRLGFALSCY